MFYPINEQISSLMESFIDPDTGELIAEVTEETMAEAIGKLQIAFDEKIDSLCTAAKSYKAEAADIRNEKMLLQKRQSSAEKAADRAKRFLGYLLQGEKFKNARHNLYYQSSEALVVDDEKELIAWCKMNAPGFLKEPELRVEDIKRAVKNGTQIPFVHIQNNKNVVVR